MSRVFAILLAHVISFQRIYAKATEHTVAPSARIKMDFVKIPDRRWTLRFVFGVAEYFTFPRNAVGLRVTEKYALFTLVL